MLSASDNLREILHQHYLAMVECSGEAALADVDHDVAGAEAEKEDPSSYDNSEQSLKVQPPSLRSQRPILRIRIPSPEICQHTWIHPVPSSSSDETRVSLSPLYCALDPSPFCRNCSPTAHVHFASPAVINSDSVGGTPFPQSPDRPCLRSLINSQHIPSSSSQSKTKSLRLECLPEAQLSPGDLDRSPSYLNVYQQERLKQYQETEDVNAEETFASFSAIHRRYSNSNLTAHPLAPQPRRSWEMPVWFRLFLVGVDVPGAAGAFHRDSSAVNLHHSTLPISPPRPKRSSCRFSVATSAEQAITDPAVLYWYRNISPSSSAADSDHPSDTLSTQSASPKLRPLPSSTRVRRVDNANSVFSPLNQTHHSCSPSPRSQPASSHTPLSPLSEYYRWEHVYDDLYDAPISPSLRLNTSPISPPRPACPPALPPKPPRPQTPTKRF